VYKFFIFLVRACVEEIYAECGRECFGALGLWKWRPIESILAGVAAANFRSGCVENVVVISLFYLEYIILFYMLCAAGSTYDMFGLSRRGFVVRLHFEAYQHH
jgi:hypothetical protein